MEWNARQQVTLWANQRLGLHEYAYRLWGDLVSDFYLPRWTRFFHEVEEAMRAGTTFVVADFWHRLESWEQSFCRETGANYTTTPTGGALAKANAIFAKYFSTLAY